MMAPVPDAEDSAIDLLIHGASLVTVDPSDRVIENGAIAIRHGRIASVGPAEELEPLKQYARRIIDGSGMAVLPGFVDAHAHAGHALTRALGRSSDEWMAIAGAVYARGADPDFWAVEAAVSALERIRCGTTTACLLFGGGPDVMRVDDTASARAHLDVIGRSGLREVLAVGPCRPPWPTIFVNRANRQSDERAIPLDRQFEVIAQLLEQKGVESDSRVRLAVSCPVFFESDLQKEGTAVIEAAQRSAALAAAHNLPLIQDGHRNGSIAFAAREFGFEGPLCLFAHCIDLTDDDLAVLERSKAKVAHNPTSLMSVRGRCPAPELRERGIVVGLGSDAPAPDRPFDMFRHMFLAMRLHARHFRDETVLLPSQVLRMATIEGAKALGLQTEIGSIEIGKRADLILVDLDKPHLTALGSLVDGIVAFASGSDVDTVIVDGRVVMEHRCVLTLDEAGALAVAPAAAKRAWTLACGSPS